MPGSAAPSCGEVLGSAAAPCGEVSGSAAAPEAHSAVLVPIAGAATLLVAVVAFCVPSKGSSVRVSSAGVVSFGPLEPPPSSCKGVARTSPVSSSALRSSSGSMSSFGAATSRVLVAALLATMVSGVAPRSTSGSINSSSRASPATRADGAGRASNWMELSRAGRTGTPPSRGSSTGRSVRGSSIRRDAASRAGTKCVDRASFHKHGMRRRRNPHASPRSAAGNSRNLPILQRQGEST